MCDFQLHGNPGDYAWGRGGLDAIITQVQWWRTSIIKASCFRWKSTFTFVVAAAEPHGWNRSSSHGQRKHCRHSHGDWNFCLFQLTSINRNLISVFVGGNIERNAGKEYILFRLLGGKPASICGFWEEGANKTKKWQIDLSFYGPKHLVYPSTTLTMI